MITALSLDSMNYTWFVVLSCSIFVAAIIGWVRFKKVDPAFRPFIFVLWIGSLNEIISILLPRLGHTTDINNNIYVLFEALLLVWQLKSWGSFGRYTHAFPLLLVAITLGWLMENFLVSAIHITLPWFRLAYSFVIVLLSIQLVNRLIISERRSLLRNPVFLISIGFIFYFTYKGLIEIFWISDFDSSPGFLINVYSIMIWINLIANIIYSIALVWMPARQRFTLPY